MDGIQDSFIPDDGNESMRPRLEDEISVVACKCKIHWCWRCEKEDVVFRRVEFYIGAYCRTCGAWIQWVDKAQLVMKD